MKNIKKESLFYIKLLTICSFLVFYQIFLIMITSVKFIFKLGSTLLLKIRKNFIFSYLISILIYSGIIFIAALRLLTNINK